MNSDPLQPDTAFLYLGHTVAFNNSDWKNLYHNLRKAWFWWGVATKVLKRTGATVRTWGILYKEVVHTVLLYGSEIQVVMGAMLKVLEGFHHWVARRFVGKTAFHIVNGEWECPPVQDTLDKSRLYTIKCYIQRWQETIEAHISYQPIYEI